MKRILLALSILLAAFAISALAAQAPKNVRTIRNLPAFPIEALKQTVQPEVLPITAYLAGRRLDRRERSGRVREIRGSARHAF
ncbi:MAG TPA: hypothetical protein VK993_09705 [Chthoniobacterales bacterium]|nr:hypothetical protein [Chthoniobacterales bacterium]